MLLIKPLGEIWQDRGLQGRGALPSLKSLGKGDETRLETERTPHTCSEGSDGGGAIPGLLKSLGK